MGLILKVIVSSSPNNYIMCINDKSIINDTEIIEIIGNYINFRENIVPCDWGAGNTVWKKGGMHNS